MKKKSPKIENWLVEELLKIQTRYASAYLIGVIQACVNNSQNSDEKIVCEIKSALASFDEANRIRGKSHEA